MQALDLRSCAKSSKNGIAHSRNSWSWQRSPSEGTFASKDHAEWNCVACSSLSFVLGHLNHKKEEKNVVWLISMYRSSNIF